MKKHTHISWKLENYAFGAVALREAIQNNKTATKDKWSVSKLIAARGLYIFAVLVTLVMIFGCIIYNVACDCVEMFNERNRKVD